MGQRICGSSPSLAIVCGFIKKRQLAQESFEKSLILDQYSIWKICY
jgi:hypothetical protein